VSSGATRFALDACIFKGVIQRVLHVHFILLRKLLEDLLVCKQELAINSFLQVVFLAAEEGYLNQFNDHQDVEEDPEDMHEVE
jgi:hypothetical protein